MEYTALKAITPDERLTAQNWAKINVQLDNTTLTNVLNDVYAGGWAFGTEDAIQDLQPNVGFDWDRWQAGNEAAAALVDPPAGLQNMLLKANVAIKGISDTSMDRIGSALALSLSQGLGAKETANAINYVINDPSRALVIARTETARALIEANLAEYRDAKVETIEWLAADPCAICAQNAGVKVTIGEAFPSGSEAPPAHPNCVCDLAPVSKYDTDVISEGRITTDDNGYIAKPDLNDLLDKDITKNYAEADNKPYVRANGNNGLAYIYQQYNYHDKPLSDNKLFNQLKEDGATVIYRGTADNPNFKSAEINNNFKTGDIHWAGQGIYGNGTYATSLERTAKSYTSNGGTYFEMVIRPNAKIIKEEKLRELINKDYEKLKKQYEKDKAALLTRYRNGDLADSYSKYKEISDALDSYFNDASKALKYDSSSYAVSRGYDIVSKKQYVNDDEIYYIILNRSAVVVNDKLIPYRWTEG
jgi:hypothetical protein